MWLSLLLAIGACSVLTAWLISRILSDRTVPTQYMFWAPTWAYLAAAAALLALSWILSFPARQRGRSQRPGRTPRVAATAALCAVAAFMFIVEWRVHALLRATPPRAGVRVLYWNAPVSAPAIAEVVLAPDADLALVANYPRSLPPQRPGERMDAIAEVRTARFLVLSRMPVLRWGETTLGLEGREQVPSPGWDLFELPEGSIDEGRAMFFELDTTATLGRTIIVWLIDLPSDQRLARWGMLRAAAARIAAWEGPVRVPGDNGLEGTPARGFPPPDLVVGDFNTPRGSASLDFLTRGMTNAFDQGGAGHTATFPRGRPFWHIDQLFVGDGLRAQRYWTIDGHDGRHLMQLAEIVPGGALPEPR